MIRLSLLSSLLIVLQTPAAWGIPTTLAAPLDAISAAIDTPPLTEVPVLFHGRLVNGSLVMPWTLCVDGTGRFLERTSGPLGEAFGFDGRQAWAVDFSGMPRTAGPGETEGERIAPWVLGGYWLATTCPLRAEPAGEDSLGAILTLQCPGDRGRSRLTVDTNTHLPVLLDRGNADGWQTMRFEEYRDDGHGIRPHRLVRTEASLGTTILIDSVRVGVAADTALFARPTAEPADFTFDPHVSSDVAVSHLPGHRHLLVRPKINGSEVGRFVLDSGATIMCLAKNVADSLGLPVVGRAVANGWNGPAETAFRQGETFELGPIRIENTKYLEMSSSLGLDSTRVRIAGIVGYDLFRRAVVEVELKGPRMRVSPVDLGTPDAAWQPLRLDEGLPAVLCTLAGGREEWFAIDTGAAMTVIFLPWLAKEQGFAPPDSTASGPFQQIDLRDFRVAGQTYARWYAFVPSGSDFPEDRWLGGALGRWLLWDYRLVFDYRHERVAMIRKTSRKRAGRG
jgi:hypothetical protein